jgi:hypothetical protein
MGNQSSFDQLIKEEVSYTESLDLDRNQELLDSRENQELLVCPLQQQPSLPTTGISESESK